LLHSNTMVRGYIFMNNIDMTYVKQLIIRIKKLVRCKNDDSFDIVVSN
jgi:hypothetical protein